MPIPLIATAIGTLGPAVAKYFGAKGAANSLRQDPNEVASQFEQLKKDMPQYGVGSAWNQYLAMSKQDPAADMQRQIAAEQEASSIGALKSGGAKALLGGLGPLRDEQHNPEWVLRQLLRQDSSQHLVNMLVFSKMWV